MLSLGSGNNRCRAQFSCTLNIVENSVFVPSAILSLMLARTLGTTVEALFYLIDNDE
jgi:hypothetical protein